MSELAYVYIMTSQPYGTLYVGVTSDLVKRIWQHGISVVDGFTKGTRLETPVWYDQHVATIEAIARGKAHQAMARDWKVNLIQSMNPEWADLYESIV